jgi:tRNA nucleotidyltransferase (CCA-adding enzyme)
MKAYLVGGSVRDELLGLPVQDRDYVVVGADPAEMVKNGYRPVGADFPVFLHPETHEEYALARTERKTAPGYRGFVFHADRNVTLEDDLRRRDLTINAMARAGDGTLIDPHGGQKDLRSGLLRHVSEAFAEDPVRILRVARFAARFDFAVAPETMKLMARMVSAGEADALVPERVWQELARGLMEKSPSRMLAVLRECGALSRVLPELDESFERPDVPDMLAERLDRAASRGYGLAVRFALLVLDLEIEAATRLCERVNAPNDCRDVALLSIQAREVVKTCDADAQSTLAVLERADAFRRPERLDRLLEVAECDTHVDSPATFGPRAQLRRALEAARSVDAGKIAKENPGDVAEAIRRARLVAIAALQPATGF